MKKFLGLLVGLLMVFGVVGNASALSFSFGSGSTIVGDALNDPGLKMQFYINEDLSTISYDLEVGETSREFYFATFWTEETSVNRKDDLSPQQIYAYIDFDSPEDETYSVGGESEGIRILFGLLQGWELSWTSKTIRYSNGLEFTINLSPASHLGLFSPQGVACKSSVYGTITYDKAADDPQEDTPSPTPEPATFMLFGIGLLSLAGISRKKK